MMNRILCQKEKNKKELYKYIDLNNCSLYMNKIEKIAEKKDEFSFRVLLNDFDQNVICNDNILKFKKDIIKNLNQMEKYFDQNLLIISEIIHQDCLDKFYKLIKNEINDLINNKNYGYYLYIKDDLYNKLVLICNSYEKITNSYMGQKQLCIINNFIENMMKNYKIKTNILRKYNCFNKELISYEDLIFMNLNNIKEAKNVLFTIKENNKVYNEKKLFNKIIEINEIKNNFNKSKTIIYCNNKQITNLVYSKINYKFDMISLNNFNKMVSIIDENNIKMYYYNYLNLCIKNINKYIECKSIYICIDFINSYNNIKTILSKYMNKLINFTKKGIGTYSL